MRCKKCNYRLWQITSRQCPECGTPFKPSDFEFVPNSVRFCCPHCNQSYYGTGEKGHLVPPAFACVTCGRDISMDDMVLLPTEGVQDEKTEAVDMPWLEQGQSSGFFKRWLKTVGRALVRPGELIRGTPVESSAWSAFVFAILSQALIAGLTTLPILILQFAVIGSFSGGGPAGGFGSRTFGIMAGIVGFGLGMILLNLVMATLVTHGMLRITGGCAHGLRRTWQAICYGSGANVLTGIPCLGGYFGWIWWVVSSILMVKDGQKVHGGRATLAVLTWPVIFFVVLIGGYAGFIYYIVHSTKWPGMSGNVNTTLIVSSLRAPAMMDPNGAAPDATSLLANQSLNPYTFVDFSDTTNGGAAGAINTCTVGGLLLSAWIPATPQAQQQAAKRATDAMTPETVAYRIGDYVLVHRGVNVKSLGANSDKMWLVVCWRESMPKGDGSRECEVGLADGSSKSFPLATFDEEMAAQNRLRAKLGLPLIPHPADVKSDQPVMRDDAKYAPPPAAKPSAPAPPGR